ncbi:hypothetical protein GM31_01085 [Trabulsiella odontotermitis]|uniref:Uncharacterized protein n=1 Tax=Trabulsiella odontotermitis TaxID=379893 RepID=A0A0L0H423_9ENTR|nr:hypothetical protein GM31_01085 [Trabulsiella odontotermitis]
MCSLAARGAGKTQTFNSALTKRLVKKRQTIIWLLAGPFQQKFAPFRQKSLPLLKKPSEDAQTLSSMRNPATFLYAFAAKN